MRTSSSLAALFIVHGSRAPARGGTRTLKYPAGSSGPQVEYGVEWKPVRRVELSNTLEWYPSFSDVTGNYLLDTQAGIRVTFWRHTFFELRAEYHHDSEPAPSAKEAEYRLIFGPGWTF